MKETKSVEPFAISVAEAARLARTGDRQMRKWIEEDPTFPAIRVGPGMGKTIIPVDAFREWLNEKAKMRMGMKPTSRIGLRILEGRRKRQEA